MLRTWKARDRHDRTRAPIRTWLHRNATNACLTTLEGQAQRPLPSGLCTPSEDPEPSETPGAPLTPAFDIPWPQPFPDTRFNTETRTDMRLTPVAAMQVPPPRQRAVLMLREVLEFTAAEAAEQLGTTAAAVNSTLYRARAALTDVGGPDEVTEPDDPQARPVIQGYVRPFEAADIPALMQLLTERGDPGDAAGAVVVPGQPRLRPVHRPHASDARDRLEHEASHRERAPTLAAYAPEPGDRNRLHTLQVFTVTGGRIAHNVVFADPHAFQAFGPPRQISTDEFRQAR